MSERGNMFGLYERDISEIKKTLDTDRVVVSIHINYRFLNTVIYLSLYTSIQDRYRCFMFL